MGSNYYIREEKLGSVLDGKTIYAIPDYQRNYEWDTEKTETLWRDLVRKDDDEYLLGSIVVIKRDDRYDVVDGQQRLATITMIFCAIRDYISKHIEQDYPSKNFLLKSLEKRIKNNGEAVLVLGESDRELFQKIQEDTNGPKNVSDLKKLYKPGKRLQKSHKLLLNNYSRLYHKVEEFCNSDELDSGEDTAEFIEKLKTKLDSILTDNTFAFVEVQNEDYAFQIFEALNTTGQKLTQASMIKNFIIKRSSKNEKIARKKKWDGIINKIPGKPDKFLYESLLSRNTSTKIKFIDPNDNGSSTVLIQLKSLYKIIKKKCMDEKSIDNYLEELEEDSKYFHWLLDPGQGFIDKKYSRTTKLVFEGMNQLDAQYIRRPILAACRELDPKSEDFEMLIESLLTFFFMFRTIHDGSTDVVRSLAQNITKCIIEKKDIKEILKVIFIKKEDTPYITNEQFLEDFKEYADGKPDIGVAKYIFTRFEEKLREDESLDIEYEDMNLEHILPQKHTEVNWPEKDFMDNTDMNIDSAQHRLGNLTLLKDKWNIILKNSSFNIKKNGIPDADPKISYKNDGLKINQEFLINYDKWTIVELEKREEKLCDFAKGIWEIE